MHYGLLRRDPDSTPDRSAHPPRDLRQGLADRALITVLVLTTLWIIVFGRLIYLRHARFGTFDFDLGIHDQAIWQMAHGHGFLTVRGLPALGHHATFAYWFFAPFYWLGAGAQFINLTQVVSLAVPAVLLFLIGRDRMRSSWHAVPFAVAWLAHPSTQWLVWETFHPESMAVIWLLSAYLLAGRGRWGGYWVCLVVALSWKEDVGLAVVMLGVVMFLWGQRRRALLTAGLGLVWFVLTTMVLIPQMTGHGSHAGTFYGELGNSSTEVAINSIRHPDVVVDRLNDNNALWYTRKAAEPFGFTSILSPVPLLVALPQAAINLLSTAYFVVDPRYHYVVIPLTAMALAMVEGVSRIRPRRIRTALGCLILISALLATRADGLSPIGIRYDDGYWPLHASDRTAVLEAAVALVDGHDGVAATWNLVPHLTHRERIYTFPNPWRTVNWGVDGEASHPDSNAEWLVLDLVAVGTVDRDVYEGLVDDGPFEEVFNVDKVVVAHRRS